MHQAFLFSKHKIDVVNAARSVRSLGRCYLHMEKLARELESQVGFDVLNTEVAGEIITVGLSAVDCLFYLDVHDSFINMAKPSSRHYHLMSSLGF
jgi:hypothetical protein